MVKLRWAGEGQLALMLDCIPEMQSDGGAQCFPLYTYHELAADTDTLTLQGTLFNTTSDEIGHQRRDGLTMRILAYFHAAYPSEDITKEDVFYYVYGILHSEDYRSRYADNLSKELPRIPCVKDPKDFWAFTKAGRTLGDLHINFESVEPYSVNYKQGTMFMDDLAHDDYRVEKMRFSTKGKDKDWSTVIYNSKITMTNIPLEAYDYVVNGKPALEWVMERQVVKTDKDSGIVNDANRYAIETVGDPTYPLKSFQRMITVSLETMKIVRSLPPLEIATGPSTQDRVAAE